MNHTRARQTADWQHPEDIKPDFNIAILYDDRSAGARAMHVANGLIQEFGDRFDFHCALWRFDMLEFPEVFGDASQTGATADLIIVSARCDGELPPAVRDWLEQCVVAKVPRSAALVGLLESRRGSAEVQCRTCHILQNVADRGLMELLLREVPSPPTNARLTRDAGDRADAASPVIQPTFQQTEPPPRPRA